MAAAAEETSYRVWRLTRHAYDLLVEAGVYEGQRVQLIEGEVVEIPPQGTEHGDTIRKLGTRLAVELAARFGDTFLVGQQTPIVVLDSSEPEPDISVVDREASTRSSHPPTAHLVVEVTWSTHVMDLRRKPAVYAAASVPQYWVIDLRNRTVVVHAEPDPGEGGDPALARYGSVRRLALDTELEVLGITLRLSDVLA